MAWVRIHDGAMGNLKIVSLTDSAFRLWVKGLCYCQMNLTDGLIPREALRDMGARRGDIDTLAAVRVEGRAPLWEEHLIGFKVHDYLFWNDCRDVVVARQSKARDRLNAWKEKHGKRHTKRVSERVDNGVGNAVGNGTDVGGGTKPNQTKREHESPSDSPRVTFDRFWAVYPKKVGKDAARRAWERRHPSGELTNTVLAALAWQIKQPQWTEQNRRFVPNPATWINAGRWQDEPPTEHPSLRWECPHDPPCSGGRNDCYVKQQIEQGKAL